MARPNIGSETEYLPGFEPPEVKTERIDLSDLPIGAPDDYGGKSTRTHRTGSTRSTHSRGMGPNAWLTAPDD